MARGDYGYSFSPIEGEETLEDLPQLLARLYGGGRVGVKKLPRPSIRGALPVGQDLLSAFLSTPEAAQPTPVGGPGAVLAPEEPVPVEGPAPAPAPASVGEGGEFVGPAPGEGIQPPMDDEYAAPPDEDYSDIQAPYDQDLPGLPGGPPSSEYPTTGGEFLNTRGAPEDTDYATGSDFLGSRGAPGGVSDYSDPNYGFGGDQGYGGEPLEGGTGGGQYDFGFGGEGGYGGEPGETARAGEAAGGGYGESDAGPGDFDWEQLFREMGIA